MARSPAVTTGIPTSSSDRVSHLGDQPVGTRCHNQTSYLELEPYCPRSVRSSAALGDTTTAATASSPCSTDNRMQQLKPRRNASQTSSQEPIEMHAVITGT